MAKKGRQGSGKKQPNPRKARGNQSEIANGGAVGVHDIIQKDQSSKQGPAEAASAVEPGSVIGLTNLGHTCFFNAAVQVLLASDLVVSQFLPERERGPLGNGLHDVVAKSHGSPVSLEEGGKTKRAKIEEYAPRKLHSAVVKIAPHFKAGVQQDSHELLRLLLDGLHNEECKPGRIKTAKQARLDESNKADNVAERPATFPSQAFKAKLTSRLECTDCDRAVTREEEFLDISVEVPNIHESSNHHSSARQAKEKPQKKKFKKAAVEVPTSADIDRKQLSMKHKKQAAKQAKKESTLARKRERRRGGVSHLEAEPTENYPPLSQEKDAQRRQSPEVAGQISQSQELPRSNDSPFESAEDSATATGNYGGVPADSNGQEGLLQSSKDGEEPQSNTSGATTSNHVPSPGEDSLSESAGSSHASPLSAGSQHRASDQEATPQASPQASETKAEMAADDDAPDTEGQAAVSHTTSNGVAKQEENSIDGAFSKLWEEDGAEPAGQEERTDGAADGAPAAEPEQEEAESQGHGNGPDESSLTACLASFFAPEQVEWECPSKEEDSGSDPAFKTPLRDNQALMSRNVSFSEERPRIRLIPGSIEQRGTDIRKAMQGEVHFCRPLRYVHEEEEVYLLVTALISQEDGTACLGIQPQNEATATLAVLEDALTDIASPTLNLGDDSGDEDEQDRVAHAVQLLMDCVADMVVHEGVENMGKMTAGGMSLYPPHRPKYVRGQFPEKMGGGCWEYPLLDPPSRDLLSRDSYLSCSSPASSGLATAPSQTLEDPSTPAAASTASFESIDLDTSPNKKAHKQQSGNFSPTFASINEGSGSAGLQSGAMQPQEPVSTEGDPNLQYESSSQSEPRAASKNDPTMQCSDKDQGQPLPLEDHPNDSSLGHPASANSLLDGSQLRDLRISSEDRDGGGDAGLQDQSADPKRTTPLKPQHLRGGLKGKGLTEEQRTKHSAKKGYLIRGAPQLLLIHLKRFQMDTKGVVRKIQGCITFPTDLDIKPYCDPQADVGSTQYNLLGVVEHQGSSMRSGHYYAYTRGTAKEASTHHTNASDLVEPEANGSKAGGQAVGETHSVDSADQEADGDSGHELVHAMGYDAQEVRHENGVPEHAVEEGSPSEPSPRDSHKGAGAANGTIDELEVQRGVVPLGEEADSRNGRDVAETDVASARQGSRVDETWFRISDEKVTRTTLQQVLASEAYILLYARRTT